MSHELQIVTNPTQVTDELTELGLNRELVIKVARAVAGARAESLPNADASNASGLLAYISGVRHTRLELLVKGWRVDRSRGVERTVNDELGIQILFQNVDKACGEDSPRAISDKGPVVREIVDEGQMELFSKPTIKSANLLGCEPQVWLLCVSVDDDYICAEVSCPESFEGKNFSGFAKRIFVYCDPIEAINLPDSDFENVDDDIDVLVTKK